MEPHQKRLPTPEERKLSREAFREVELSAYKAALRLRSDHQAKIAAMETVTRRMAPFADRGLSKRTIDALIAGGIDVPERLLFATETDLKNIPGIGKVSFEEIMRYRARFLPGQRMDG